MPAPIWSEDFEGSGDLAARGFLVSGNPNAVLDGGILRVTLDREIDLVKDRTEIVPRWLPPPHVTEGLYQSFKVPFWLSWRMRLGVDYDQDTGSGESLVQWVGNADVGVLEEIGRNPAMVFGLHEDQYKVWVRADNKPRTPAAGVPGRYTRDDLIPIGPHVDDRGVWVSWAINYRFDPHGGGMLCVWKNGAVVYSEEGLPLGYNDAKGPTLKIGIYKWPWFDGITAVNRRHCDYDDVVLGVGHVDASMFDETGWVDV